jgi:hypothetical protein
MDARATRTTYPRAVPRVPKAGVVSEDVPRVIIHEGNAERAFLITARGVQTHAIYK